jgi:2-polyprenyl-3-methyl-5-hydroxy-6-metoxy-1,4-benzoquinol methylase
MPPSIGQLKWTEQGRDADRKHWSRVAAEWIAFARAPNHDAFWAFRRELASFIGRGDGEALDVGCGEGRVARELRALGYTVTAVDAVDTLVVAAADVGSAHHYAITDAAELPFGKGTFDLVVAYNVLMDVVDVPAAVKEMRRVLRPGGELVISIVHPFTDRGRISGSGPSAHLVIGGTYFGRQHFQGQEERNGLRMHFAGWSQPLEAYAAALEAAGLAITSIREPIPDIAHGRADLQPWIRVPLFLWLKARSVTYMLHCPE